jgi:hypothetical protein
MGCTLKKVRKRILVLFSSLRPPSVPADSLQQNDPNLTRLLHHDRNNPPPFSNREVRSSDSSSSEERRRRIEDHRRCVSRLGLLAVFGRVDRGVVCLGVSDGERGAERWFALFSFCLVRFFLLDRPITTLDGRLMSAPASPRCCAGDRLPPPRAHLCDGVFGAHHGTDASTLSLISAFAGTVACAGKGIHSQNHVAKVKPAVQELMQK